MSNPNRGAVLALIAAYNEAERVGDVVAGAGAHLPVLVVDDGSSDDTPERAEAAGAEVVRQRANRGKGAALKAGFRAALERGFEAALTLDADGQHDPAEIPKFLRARASGRPDLVIGARDFDRMPPVRRLSNEVGRRALSWALGRRVLDNQSGYRLASRRLMRAMLASEESAFEFEVEMVVRVIQRGWTLEWVPIRTIYTGEDSHIRPLRHTAHFFRMVWRARRAVGE